MPRPMTLQDQQVLLAMSHEIGTPNLLRWLGSIYQGLDPKGTEVVQREAKKLANLIDRDQAGPPADLFTPKADGGPIQTPEGGPDAP